MTKASEKPSGEGQSKPTGRYRKVEVRTWGDERFRALSAIPPCGQGLWLYLITGPHTGPIPGLFRAGRAGMAEELGWELEDFDKAFAEVLAQGIVKADLKARVMWIPNAVRCNRPESPNVVRGWAAEFDLIPECDLKREAYSRLREALCLVGESFVAAFDEAIRKPSGKALPKPLANQEQEQDAGTGSATGAGVVGGAAAASKPPAAEAAATRGTRLPANWTLPKAWGDWAIAAYPHWTPDVVRLIATKFGNHWRGKSGKDATKLDWKATWENWCLSGITQGEHPAPKSARPIAGQVGESLAKAERLRVAMQATGGAVAPAVASEVIDG